MALLLSSSPPPHPPHEMRDFRRRVNHGPHHGLVLVAPSSPSAAYLDAGEISPSLDASFASSMSITSDSITEQSPVNGSNFPSHQSHTASSPHLMDISPLPNPPQRRIDQVLRPSLLPRFSPPLPAPSQQLSSSKPAPTAFPFLQNLLLARSTSNAPSSTSNSGSTESEESEEQRCHSPESFFAEGGAAEFSTGRPVIQHFATVPPSHAESLLPPFIQKSRKTHSFEGLTSRNGERIEASASQELNDDAVDSDEGFMAPPKSGNSSQRPRGGLPTSWKPTSRHTAPVGGLQPPPLPVPKRLSEPMIPTFRTIESSPVRMDIDGSSPFHAHHSPPSRQRPLQHPRSTNDIRSPPSPARGQPGRSASDIGGSRMRRTFSDADADAHLILKGDLSSPDDPRLGDIFAQNVSPSPFIVVGQDDDVEVVHVDDDDDDDDGHEHAGEPSPSAGLLSSPKRNKNNSRKRFLEIENSPTPNFGSSPTPITGSVNSLTLGSTAPLVIPPRKSSSNSLRKRGSTLEGETRSSAGLLGVGTGVHRRPPLGSSNTVTGNDFLGGGGKMDGTTFKRHAQAFNNKPTLVAERAGGKGRRAYSVADGGSGLFSNRDINTLVEANSAYNRNSTGTTSSHSTAAMNEGGYFEFEVKRSRNSGGGSGGSGSGTRGHCPMKGMMENRNTTGNGVSMDAGAGMGKPKAEASHFGLGSSPVTGFRSQETKGKALPCFGVKEDGLMRITSDTLLSLQRGEFSDAITRYLVIDCRFSYEYEGGHIAQAINLPTTAEVEAVLLDIESPPTPSTSEEGPLDGGKTVLIFHCEFSAKRGPTSAKHLRSKDRLLNTASYPRVHYPEVYILQGGYADFYKKFPEHCVGGYLPMDDPGYNATRVVELNAFRQQTRHFNRASSFTFGQAQSAAGILKAASVSSSFGAPPSSSNFNISNNISNNNNSKRPPLARSKTLAPVGFSFPSTGNATSTTSSSTLAASSRQQAESTRMSITEEEHDGDSSFGTNTGSSPGGGDDGDSPCPTSKYKVAVGRHSLKVPTEAGGGRRVFARAQTAVSMFGR